MNIRALYASFQNFLYKISDNDKVCIELYSFSQFIGSMRKHTNFPPFLIRLMSSLVMHDSCVIYVDDKNVEILRSISTLFLQCPFSVINVPGRRLLSYPRYKNSRNALDENLTVIILFETD
jgi:hypothetical protein